MKKRLLFIVLRSTFVFVLSTQIVQAMENDFDASSTKTALKKAAVRGDAIAQDNLGELYLKEKKPVKALKWFMESASQEYASSQNHLGVMYAKEERSEG